MLIIFCFESTTIEQQHIKIIIKTHTHTHIYALIFHIYFFFLPEINCKCTHHFAQWQTYQNKWPCEKKNNNVQMQNEIMCGSNGSPFYIESTNIENRLHVMFSLCLYFFSFSYYIAADCETTTRQEHTLWCIETRHKIYLKKNEIKRIQGEIEHDLFRRQTVMMTKFADSDISAIFQIVQTFRYTTHLTLRVFFTKKKHKQKKKEIERKRTLNRETPMAY